MGIVLNEIKKDYDGFQALKSINLVIEDGEFVAILGPSGCGKTTLLRLLAGFSAPSAGSILVHGEEVANAHFFLPPEKRNIGMAFQSFALWPHMNVREHILFPLRHHQFSKKIGNRNMQIRVEEVLEMVGMAHLGDRYPHELSGGQKQRVALARAIAPKPKLLLMDEPLSSLDAELRMEMRREIQQIHRLTQATIVYVTHDQGEALAMADKMVVMHKGEVEQIGTPQDVYTYPTSPFVASFVGKANLLKGKWEGEFFYPSTSPKQKWKDIGVAKEFKKLQLYPVRPEQLKLAKDKEGIQGIITNVQYQGKEIHYTVEVDGDEWGVHEPFQHMYFVGELVAIHPAWENIHVLQK